MSAILNATGDEVAPGDPSQLVDAESLGEQVMKPIKLTPADQVLMWMREKFREGYVMYAHDLDAPILEPINGDDGTEGFVTGLIVQPMRDRPRKVKGPEEAPTVDK